MPARDAMAAIMVNPMVPENKRFCSVCGEPVGRGRDGVPGPHRGLLPQGPHAVLLRAQAARRGPGRPVRGARLHRARRPGLDLPGPGPERLGPLGGPQGPAGLRRRRRDGRGRRRAPVPGRGQPPLDRADPELRAAPGPPDRGPGGLHRHGVRRRQLPEADPRRLPRPGRPRHAAAGRAGHRLRDRDPAGVRLPARAGPGLLRLQAGQHHPVRGAAQAHRHGRGHAGRRRGLGDLRHRRLPGPGDRPGGPLAGVRHLHRRPHRWPS